MTINSIPSRTRTLPFLLVALMAAGACADAVSDPMAALMAQETRAALDFGGAVPSLADVWVESGGILDEVPVTRWEDSWELPAREGRALRALVYDDAVPVSSDASAKAPWRSSWSTWIRPWPGSTNSPPSVSRSG